ncbi:Plasmodium vivax Vir protein, putative [Plasmodium vivax]|uniref:Vir protein, putative n=1 Tax=Plasmodium vivax TaxID=5855 RepID=A0A1G4E1M2_PLAVI|nr:Plasmodium vivax Vir protein, putative [Plasmodium vivax]
MEDFELDEYYNSVKYFPKYEGEFNNITAGSANSYIQQCNYIISSCFDGKLDFFKSCSNIAAFIKHLQYKADSIEKSQKCNFLNYKINDEVKKLKNVSYNNVDFYNKLINGYKKYVHNLNIICKKNIGYLDEDIFRKIEDLYKIYTRFNRFVLPSSSSDVSNCQDITDPVDIYNKHKGTCENDINKDFCVALDNFKNDYQTIIGKIITKCKDAEEYLQSYVKLSENTVLLLQEDEGSGERGASGDRGISGEIGETGGRRDTILQDSLAQEGSHEMGNSKSTMTIALSSMLVLSSASFLMYKFTPFGSWLRPLIQRNMKQSDKMNEEVLRFYPNSSGNHMDIENSRYNIQYH